MSVWNLALKEIRHRKTNFALSLLSVAVAVACLVGSQTLLSIDALETEAILAAKQSEIETAISEREEAVAAAGKALQDSVRKQMLGLGFNILILPESQDLSELHLDGTLTESMPESYVDKLANSKIVTVNHLLPSVTKRVQWPEKEIDVIVHGTRGEVPIMHRGLKKPLLAAVPPGTIVAGYQIHQKLGLSIDDTVTLMGRQFKVTTLHPERGSSDDVTVWIDLAEAQEMLGMQNVINAILALECDCAGDRISQVRAEIAGILPGTQVIEKYSQAVTRAESRAKAKTIAEAALSEERQAGEAALKREQQSRAEIQNRHAGLVGVLVPLVLVGAALWIAFLAWGNARQRSGEIGILRAIGLSSKQVQIMFLLKACMTGVPGGLLGVLLGIAAGVWLSNPDSGVDVSAQLSGQAPVLMTVCLAPILAPAFSIISSWLPAQIAANCDPATILQAES